MQGIASISERASLCGNAVHGLAGNGRLPPVYRRYGVDVRIARIFNAYGPHMYPADGSVVSNFITQALADAPLTVHGDGRQ